MFLRKKIVSPWYKVRGQRGFVFTLLDKTPPTKQLKKKPKKWQLEYFET